MKERTVTIPFMEFYMAGEHVEMKIRMTDGTVVTRYIDKKEWSIITLYMARVATKEIDDINLIKVTVPFFKQ